MIGVVEDGYKASVYVLLCWQYDESPMGEWAICDSFSMYMYFSITTVSNQLHMQSRTQTTLSHEEKGLVTFELFLVVPSQQY